MKKALVFVATVFITVNANAQWFMGGYLGVSAKNEEESRQYDFEHYKIKTNEFGFTIAPRSGYYFNEKFALGLSLSFHVGTFHKIEPSVSFNGLNGEIDTRGHTFNYGVSPFVRFSVFTYKKISIQLETSIGIGYEEGKQSFLHTLTDTKSEFTHSVIDINVLNVTPIVSFKLSKHFQLEAGLYFLNLGYSINIQSEPNDNVGVSYKRTSTTHNFNTAFNSSNILAINWLRIGAIYKF